LVVIGEVQQPPKIPRRDRIRLAEAFRHRVRSLSGFFRLVKRGWRSECRRVLGVTLLAPMHHLGEPVSSPVVPIANGLPAVSVFGSGGLADSVEPLGGSMAMLAPVASAASWRLPHAVVGPWHYVVSLDLPARTAIETHRTPIPLLAPHVLLGTSIRP